MVAKSGQNIIDSVLSGYKWQGGSLAYAFPDSASDYNYGDEPDRRFGTVSASQQQAARFALDADTGSAADDGFSVEGFTNLTMSPGSDTGADIRLAMSNSANPTAYGYFPTGSDKDGDIWFGRKTDYRNATPGDYEWATVLHEIGHALGLKHAHERMGGFPAISNDRDSLEYTIMTYHSSVKTTSYANEEFGFPQTYMMADIAGLQYMYGADFSTNSGNTTYKWNPGSGDTLVDGAIAIDAGGKRILATIWDGDGIDTYDLSSYSSNLKIDLSPGGHSVFSKSQLADLNAFASGGLARGSIFNALLYEGDTRSLIENAIGGSGNDRLTGNQANNSLTGGGGADTLIGGAGNDLLTGNDGADQFHFRGNFDTDTIADFQNGIDRIVFDDLAVSNASDVLALAVQSGADVRIDFGNGDVLVIANTQVASLDNSDFMFI